MERETEQKGQDRKKRVKYRDTPPVKTGGNGAGEPEPRRQPGPGLRVLNRRQLPTIHPNAKSRALNYQGTIKIIYCTQKVYFIYAIYLVYNLFDM